MLLRSLLLTLIVLVTACAGKKPVDTVEAAAPPTHELRIVATVPPGSGDVYLAGNLPELGPWDPGKFVMNGSGEEREAVLQVPAGTDVEFKLTRGSWIREAVDGQCKARANEKVKVDGDTTVRVAIERFRDPSVECPWPDPERWRSAIDAYTEKDKLNPPAPGGVLFVGSSSVVGWHGTIHEDLAPLPIIARGFGGSTMHDLLVYTDRIVLPYRPATIVVYEGDNDIAGAVFPETVLGEFEKFIAIVRAALPETEIYFIPAKPSPSRWELWPRMQELNAGLEALCAKDPKLHMIDIVTPMLGPDGTPRPELFKEDRLHMKPEGYRIWTEKVREALIH